MKVSDCSGIFIVMEKKKSEEKKKKKNNSFTVSITPSGCLVRPINITINLVEDRKKK